jgi:hypothetical protein
MPRDIQSDGEDASAALFGQTMVRRKPLFWEYGRNTNAFGFPGIAQNRSPNVAVRDGAWKLLVYADGTGAELYDVVRDPNETHNMIGEQSDTSNRLTRAALEWRKSLPAR